jgi:acetyl/propionyl-CoA carboxylase alpha subunit
VSLRKDRPLHGHAGQVIGRPFGSVLVANRGEIALRVIRACRELDVRSIAVYSDADAGARHVRAADVAVRIGRAPAAESYLRGDRIVEAAVMAGAEAVHPGYGFLSEQASFAETCEAAGLVFVGPGPETLASLGNKLAARRAAQAQGVPILPGTFEPLPAASPASMEAIRVAAASVGFPLLIKAAAGGGGRGMRRVDNTEELPIAVAAAAREAEVAFGDGSVYLERYAEGARHVEVQLVGDAHGAVVAIGERDCSTQRRHQKLVEEAPAPGLSPEQRRELHALAVRVARTVGLRNAATAEFLVSAEGEYFFLEVNARIQVEHGVTELVTGVDLVHEQLWLAAGRPLSSAVLAAAAEATDPGRHAIEARISAEDPARAFAPVPGRVTRWQEPAGPGVRMDSAAEEGMLVSSEYDPLLAKLMVVAEDRPAALSRLRRALLEFETGGVQTTLPFHRWLLVHPAFLEGRLRTDLIDRDWDPVPIREAAARAATDAVARHVAGLAAVGNVRGVSSAVEGGRPADPAGLSSAASSSPWSLAARREATERWP